MAAVAERVPARYRVLVLVAAFGGLRWGELAGLRRKRVGLDRGTVTVVEQLLEVNGTFSVGPPKSAAGRRTVVLPAVVVEALADHLPRYTATSPVGRLPQAGVPIGAGTWSAVPPESSPPVPEARSASVV